MLVSTEAGIDATAGWSVGASGHSALSAAGASSEPDGSRDVEDEEGGGVGVDDATDDGAGVDDAGEVGLEDAGDGVVDGVDDGAGDLFFSANVSTWTAR
jgi:hypothetical protein